MFNIKKVFNMTRYGLPISPDSGARWRRAVWQVAAAHTIASVTRHWHGHPPPPPVPPTHTPRTQIASGPSRPSSASPLPPTPTLELLDEPEAQPSPGHVGLDGYVNLEELTGTLKCLYKLSLEYALDDDTVVHFLGEWDQRDSEDICVIV